MPYTLPIILLTLLLGACTNNVAKPNELVPLVGKVAINDNWQQKVGQGLGRTYRVMSPVRLGDAIYANDIAGNIFAYAADNGELLWQQALDLDIAAGVGVDSESVYVGSLDGDVVMLNRADGLELWRVNIGSEILAPPQSNGAVVVVQTNNGELLGLDAKTGESLWDFSATLPILTLRGTATPLLFGDNLVAGFANGKLMAFSASDGTLFWERRIARPQGRSDIERVVDIDGQPVLAGRTLFTTSYNGTLSALSPDGTILWSVQTSSYSSPVVINGRVFVSTEDGVMRAFDARSGAPLWENSSLFRRQLSAPQNLNGFVVVADFEGYVHIFDTETGVIIARRQIDGAGVRSPMLASNDALYVLGNNGVLAALDIRLLDPKTLSQ